MIRQATEFLRRFRKEEDGNATVEFAVVVPLVFTLFMTSVELGIYAVRQNFLDRGLDLAVRDVRLNTGANFEHDDLKKRICAYAGFLNDCENALKLEMNPIDARSFAGFDPDPDCRDISEPINPSRTFEHGSEHQLMMIRACYQFNPVFPTTGLGKAYTKAKDGSGRVTMVSLSAFVQEPI